MLRGQEVAEKKMTLKERVKLILLSLFFIVVLTGALFFFINTCGSTIIDIFTGENTVYYSWKDVLILLYFPVMVYFDVLVFLFLFHPLSFRLAKLWIKMINIIWGYVVLAFFLTLPLSLYISFFPLAGYHSCSKGGPFSGVYYVKVPQMCAQIKYHSESDNAPAPVPPADVNIK
ncbi:Protein of unknown function (DUF1240) [Enterobacteriaceae bacterium strain FGI 57]|nr:Protein of unknown function (DUF1240) [Enterobacteriaceae bacterium strain FGI 57]